MTTDTNKLPAEVLGSFEALETDKGQWVVVEHMRGERVLVASAQTPSMARRIAVALNASPGPALEAENARLREALVDILWVEAMEALS